MSAKKFQVDSSSSIPKKTYEFLTEEQMQIKEQKYVNHITNLKECINYIKAASSAVEQLNEQQENTKQWQEYVDCCPIPKAHLPADIRLFVEKLKYFENISNEKSAISWLLSVDNRSILSQDFNRRDLTYSTLKLQNQTNFVLEYEKNIGTCLKMLQRIEDFWENNLNLEQYGMDKLLDIIKIKSGLQQEIMEHFNRFTYRVLSSEESYMNSIDVITTEYSYQADNFQIHIWALKNVPIRFPQLEKPYLIANLYGIKSTLSIPTCIMEQNFTIRALHLDFDHITENCQEITNLLANSSLGIQDLTECLNNEWLMQLEIQSHVKNQLLQRQQEYEEKRQLFEKQEEKKKNKRNIEKDTEKSKTSVAKPTSEPDFISDDMFPDTWEDFLEEDQRAYDSYFNTMLENRPSDPDEINLRKYFILGGIYQFYQVQKPKHFDFNRFNMTWHLDKSNLVINEALVVTAKPFRSKSKVFKRETRTSFSNRVEDFTDSADDHKDPWFVLTIQLPEELCNWDQPIVCQYETVTKLKTEMEDVSPAETRKPSKTVKQQPQKETLKINGLSSSILNMQPSPKENFFRTSLSNVRVNFLSDEYTTKNRVRDQEGILNVWDFDLDSLLGKPKLRQIERHVLPRMISSFKFNKEVQEDALAAQQVKSKFKAKKGGILIRKRSDEDIAATVDNRIFALEPMQNSPERLIPIYGPTEAIRIIQQLETDTEQSNVSHDDPKTFAELVKLINFIKWLHKVKERKIMDLKPFKSRIRVVNKHLKASRRNNLKLLLEKRPSASSLQASVLPLAQSDSHVKKEAERSVFKTTFESVQNNRDENDTKEDLSTNTYTYWTTKHIIKSEFNREKQTVEVQTNRLGYFGLAFKRYEHFPFKFWQLEPNQDGQANEIIFSLTTQYVACTFCINEEGYKVRVTEPMTKFMSKPKVYLLIDEPATNLKQLKRIFKEKHLNIYPDRDASLYVENGKSGMK